PGRLPAFADGPDDQRLAASHIACREDAGDVGHLLRVGRDVAALVDFNAELLQHSLPFGSEEAHCKKHEIGIDREFAPGNFAHVAAFKFNAAAVELFDLSIAAGKTLCQ